MCDRLYHYSPFVVFHKTLQQCLFVASKCETHSSTEVFQDLLGRFLPVELCVVSGETQHRIITVTHNELALLWILLAGLLPGASTDNAGTDGPLENG